MCVGLPPWALYFIISAPAKWYRQLFKAFKPPSPRNEAPPLQLGKVSTLFQKQTNIFLSPPLARESLNNDEHVVQHI